MLKNKPASVSIFIFLSMLMCLPSIVTPAEAPSISATPPAGQAAGLQIAPPDDLADISEIKATIIQVAGRVVVRRKGGLFWHDARKGDFLKAGDEILTKSDGRLEFELENGNILKLKPNTRLVIIKITQNNLTGEYENFFEANTGKVWAKIQKISGSSTFRIKTPTATAGARGTVIYLVVFPDSTQVLFQEGLGFLSNEASGRVYENLSPGGIYEMDATGNIFGPIIPTEQQLADLTAGWDFSPGGGAEGYSPPDDANGALQGDIDNQVNNEQDSADQSVDDKNNSQETSRTNYNGLLSATATTDADGDGVNDDIEDASWWVASDKTKLDSDNDGISDLDDAFPTEPTLIETRDLMRQKEWSVLDSERAMLRQDIQDMLSDTYDRSIDAVMEKASDAQTGKALTDKDGYRVRVEQYVLRPNDTTVQVLNVSLYTNPSCNGLNTLDWRTTFNQSIGGLTGAQLRDLPWGAYLKESLSYDKGRLAYVISGGPDYGSAKPDYYPALMSVEIANSSGDIFREKRELGAIAASGGKWGQAITSDQIYASGAWRDFTLSAESGSGNPGGFMYNPVGLNSDWDIRARFYVIGDDTAGRIGNMGGKKFDTIWEALGVNLPGYEDIGDRNLEISLSSNKYAKDIRLIYIPWTRQHWK